MSPTATRLHPMRGIIAALLIVGFMFTYIWWIVAAICLTIAIRALVDGARQARTARLTGTQQAQAIAARADEQHTLALAGHPQGMHGIYPPAA